MTLLACIRTPNSLIVGADSAAMDLQTAVSYTVEKLYRIGQKNVVWGFAGDDSVGYEFKSWADSKKSAVINWDAVREEATQKLAELNGRNRALASIAHAQNDAKVAEVLIAGYLGTPRILVIRNDGSSTFCEEDLSVFLGSGTGHARIVWEALCRAGHDANADTLQITLETVADSLAGCGRPIRLLEITEDEVNPLD
jgi:ATP-dependent protease HslVU (ClpYQ) peptidase subunit